MAYHHHIGSCCHRGQTHILEAGREAFLIIGTECALGGESRIGVLPAMTPIAKKVWNRIRRHTNGPQQRLITDRQYGGPAPVQAFLTPEQRRPANELDFQHRRPRWAERYFLLRPQFGNAGVPEYPDRSDGGTLPLYTSIWSNNGHRLPLASPDYSSQSAVSVR